MQQARYSPNNRGHFGLASMYYTHFTSPIRRYPDLIVHRILQQTLSTKNNIQAEEGADNPEKIKADATFLSERERLAITAERDIHDRLRTFYMEQFIGDSFEGIISGVTSQALFVEIVEPYVQGSIGVEELKDDYYIFDDKKYRLIGEISMNTYQIGDEIKVTLVGVNKVRSRIHFIPHSEELSD